MGELLWAGRARQGDRDRERNGKGDEREGNARFCPELGVGCGYLRLVARVGLGRDARGGG